MRTILQYLLPHKIISKIADLSANCQIPWVKNYLIGYFLKRYAVNMQEAIIEDPFAYKSYNQFFTRLLKPECRPIDLNKNSILSPADGNLAQFGPISHQNIIQAKGKYFSTPELLGNVNDAELFTDGSFATIYLAPRDYHRVHMPLEGKLQKMIYIPGKLFSVNQHAAENIPNVFARNERVVCIFSTIAGPMALILVGAMIVGSIETAWAGTVSPPHSKLVHSYEYITKNPPITLTKGQEMGLFKLGSTVIVLFAKDSIMWQQSIKINHDVKFGQQLGLVNNTHSEQT